MTVNKFFCIITVFCSYIMNISAIPTPDHFMHALRDDIKLRNLSLLGAHDAGTYALDPSLGVSPDESTTIKNIGKIPFIGDLIDKTIIKSWAQAQTNDITTQLHDGVRYFDLRIAVDSTGEFRICHGIYGSVLDDLLYQFSNFLNLHPQEIVFLDFQHLYDQNGDEMTTNQQIQLIQKLQQRLGTKIASSSLDVDVTLGEMRQEKNQVIVFWKNATTAANFPALVWDRTTFLCSTWYNLDNWSDLEVSLNEGLAAQTQSQFFVNQAVLTPDATMIAENFFSNLLTIEAQANTQILPWYQQKALEGNAGNILMIDHEATVFQRAFEISWNYNSQL